MELAWSMMDIHSRGGGECSGGTNRPPAPGLGSPPIDVHAVFHDEPLPDE